jgi:hypothetical protein
VKFKIAAGAEFDVVTEKEMRGALADFQTNWIAELSRGDRYRDFRASGTIAAAALSIGGDTDAGIDLGPAPGFVWSITRLAVVNLATNDVLTLFKNENAPSSTIKPVLLTYNSFGRNELVLYPGDRLLVEGSSLAGTGKVTITGTAREIPVALAWRLGQ